MMDSSKMTEFEHIKIKLPKKLDKEGNVTREGIINGNVDRYFRNYLTLGEALFNSEEKKDYAYIPHPIKTAVSINFMAFVISNLAIKWILEDLNYKTQQSEDYSNETFTMRVS